MVDMIIESKFCNGETCTKCPECGGELITMCVIGADQSSSGFTERWKNCDCCTSDWETYYDKNTNKEVIKRHVWG